MADEEPFDGVLSQCVTHVPFEYRQRTVLFGLGSANRKILRKENIRNYLIENPLRGFWVNNNTISKALKSVGVDTKVMYRANDISIPKNVLLGLPTNLLFGMLVLGMVVYRIIKNLL